MVWLMPTTLSPSVDPALIDGFTSIFRNYPAGVVVVTADPGDGPVALVASSLSSLSAEPPYLAFSVSDATTASPAVARADTVVIHVFGSGRIDFVQQLARSGSDRFADSERWTRLPGGEPLFRGARGWLRGVIEQRVRAGTSTLNVVRVLETGGDAEDDHRPLVYHDRTWHELGAHSRVGA
jgi:flavin reductase (DIM6/NTAB) family NADH-FMN oxidoreductase RutF